MRHLLKVLITTTALATALTLSFVLTPASARADTVVRIDQITDLGAAGTRGMFRFSPNLVRIDVGESVSFLNSTGQHTVHTIPKIWPEEAAVVKLSHQATAQVTFDKAGYYGFHCRRHGTYGMVLLVVVGHADDTIASTSGLAELAMGFRGSDKAHAAFSDIVKEYRAKLQ